MSTSGVDVDARAQRGKAKFGAGDAARESNPKFGGVVAVLERFFVDKKGKTKPKARIRAPMAFLIVRLS